MDILNPYNLIIIASGVIIFSFLFGELARKTNVPSVLMLIFLGIGLKFAVDSTGMENVSERLQPVLEMLGIIGLIMIVLEAALELELKQEKYIPIAKAFFIALIGLLLSAWVFAFIFLQFIPGMTTITAWLYATSLAVLSSSIVIPSVGGLINAKKEFHIYESTFSDILGIMLFYFLVGQFESAEQSSGLAGFGGNILLTILLSFLASYLIVLIFQKIRSHVKLFLLITVLLLLYSLGKKMHLSSLIIILIFGLVIANMRLFFRGPLSRWLDIEKAKDIYEGLHVITMETAFVVRTFFFVIFGMTISLAAVANLNVALISGLIILCIYLIRYAVIRPTMGEDIIPQVFIAPRGLITILLFYAIPAEAEVAGFEPGILLFIIIATSLIMSFALVYDKRRSSEAIRKTQERPVGFSKWKAPTVEVLKEAQEEKS